MNKILRFVEPTYDFNLTNPKSILINQIPDAVVSGEYHTSLGDIRKEDVLKLVPMFDVFELVLDNHDINSDLYKETVILLNSLSHRIPVRNLPKTSPNQFLSGIDIHRRDSDCMLWTFGCSHTWGAGLDRVDQRYSNIMAKKLGIPLRVVAQPGSSIDWSFRHLINSNLSSNDVVVWQLTTSPRFTKLKNYYQDSEEILLVSATKIDVLFWTDEQLYIKQLSTLSAGVIYLREKGCKFVLTSLNSKSELDYQLLLEYTKYPEYCYLPNHVVDLGNDDMHYGPLTHNNIASGILDHLKFFYD